MRVLVRWQVARWLRAHPGPIGIAVIALMPLVYFAPLGRIPPFTDWRHGASAAALMAALVLAGICARDSASVPDAAVWLFQKGIGIQDAFLARWSIDMGFVLIACTWNGLGIMIAGLVYDAFAPGWVLRVTAAAMLVAMLAGVMLFGVAAAGSNRGGDLLVLLIFLSVLEPVGSMLLSPAGRTLVHAVLLPLSETARLPARLHDDPLSALHHGFHFVAWCTVWIGFGTWRLKTWRPLPAVR